MFKEGDLVTLKSGGPVMIVAAINERQVAVCWQAQAVDCRWVTYRENFNFAVVAKYTQAKPWGDERPKI